MNFLICANGIGKWCTFWHFCMKFWIFQWNFDGKNFSFSFQERWVEPTVSKFSKFNSKGLPNRLWNEKLHTRQDMNFQIKIQPGYLIQFFGHTKHSFKIEHKIYNCFTYGFLIITEKLFDIFFFFFSFKLIQ